MSSGAKVLSAFIRETTPGITPAGVWNLFKRTSWGVGPSQNTNDNDEIGGTRMAQGATLGTVDVGGDVGAKFRYGQHDDFLASCFGAEWAGNVLTMGNDRISFSLATYASDVGIASIVRGAQVSVFQLEVPNDGDVTATVTFAGLGWDSKADDTSYISGTPADNAGELRYSFKEVTAINLNGIDGGDGFCIDTFNIQFDNNVQTQRCIGTGSPFAGPISRPPLRLQVRSLCRGQKPRGRSGAKRLPAQPCYSVSRWRMTKVSTVSLSRKCRSLATGRMAVIPTLSRFNWISLRPTSHRPLPALLPSQPRQSA